MLIFNSGSNVLLIKLLYNFKFGKRHHLFGQFKKSTKSTQPRLIRITNTVMLLSTNKHSNKQLNNILEIFALPMFRYLFSILFSPQLYSNCDVHHLAASLHRYTKSLPVTYRYDKVWQLWLVFWLAGGYLQRQQN